MSHPATSGSQDTKDYELVLRAIEYVVRKDPRLPSLGEFAQALKISTKDWQSMIDRWTGVQPKCYLEPLLQVCSRRLPKECFAELDNDRIPSLPGRSKALSITLETVPEEKKAKRGKGLTINYGWFVSPFGGVLSLGTRDWLCGMKFCDEKDYKAALSNMRSRWPQAKLVDDDPNAVKALTEAAFEDGEVRLKIMGTPKQIKVWETLLNIPSGQVTSYSKVASNVGKPKGTQAVGQANSRNPIPWLIPCHRVLKKDGALGKSHLSQNNQRAMLAWEAFRADATA